MRKLLYGLIVFMMVAGFGMTAQAAEQKPFVVHFVVVSETVPAGGDFATALTQFKSEVVKLAGGYTELGATHGSTLDSDGKQEENISFIIGADKDITIELKELSKKLFGGDGAFILSWPGKVMF